MNIQDKINLLSNYIKSQKGVEAVVPVVAFVIKHGGTDKTGGPLSLVLYMTLAEIVLDNDLSKALIGGTYNDALAQAEKQTGIDLSEFKIKGDEK